MIFAKKLKSYTGLDISDLSLKIAQLNKMGDKIRITGLGKKDLPLGVIENGEIKDKEILIKVINELISKPQYGSITSREVVACLPETKTFIKLIEVEKTPNKLADVIENEIEKHIPFSISEMYYDWQIVKEDDDKIFVVVGAAPKNIVDQYIEILTEAKISVVALEIESEAICRALLKEESVNLGQASKNYGIIDIGATRTSMVIYANNSIILSVTMPISGEDATRRIAKILEIKNEQAEKAKIICGLDRMQAQGIISDILSDMINELINKIEGVLEFYRDNYENLGAINEILLCGGGSYIKDLDKIITDKLSIQARKGTIFTNITSEEKLANILLETHNLNIASKKDKKEQSLSIKQDSGLTYTTAIGLALRNIFIDKS